MWLTAFSRMVSGSQGMIPDLKDLVSDSIFQQNSFVKCPHLSVSLTALYAL